MRVSLNLSLRASARDRYALAWALPVTLAAVAALVLIGRASLREYRTYHDMQRQLTEVQKRLDELKIQEAASKRKFDYPAYRDLLRRSNFVNELIDERKLSLAELSARLAGLLPQDARLTGLGLSYPKKPGDDFTVRMGITAKGEDAVETFINDLEDSVDFKDVSIINQGFQEESSQGEEVNLICTARYLPGAEEEVEEASQPTESGNKNADKSKQSEGAHAKEPTPNRKPNR
jgi:hypothetical protein